MPSVVLFNADFASDTLATAGEITTAFSPYLTLVVGALIAIVLVVVLIRAFTR